MAISANIDTYYKYLISEVYDIIRDENELVTDNF